MQHKISAGMLASLICLSASAAAAGHGQGRAVPTPRELLTAPSDPLLYLATKTRAEALLGQGKAAEAEPLAERITREYPRDGSNWLLLGEIKEKLKKYAEAAAANERAGEQLGWGLTEVPFLRAARNHLAAGNRRAALDLLRTEVVERGSILRQALYGVDEFAPLRSDPEFLEIVGRIDSTGWSRDYGWQRDVDFLYEEVRRLSSHARTGPLPLEFQQRYKLLKEKIPRLSDEAIFVGMSHMLAALRQGHTEIWGGGSSRIPARRLPFQLWAFPEGMFVVDAIDQHKDLIGSRLTAIEGVPAEEVLRRVNEVQSVEGDYEYLMLGTQYLRNTSILKGLGIAQSDASIRVTLQKPGGPKRTLTVGTPQSDFSLSLEAPPGLKEPLLLYRDKGKRHWGVPLPERNAYYLQFNGVRDEKDSSLTQLGERLQREFQTSGLKNLIIDMRHNGGGSTRQYYSLLRDLVAISKMPGRKIYVLTSRNVYSAASNFITDLERLASPTFVGEAPSGCCSLYGDPGDFTLPYSKISGRAAGVKWNLSGNAFDGRREIAPHVPVTLTARDYFAGRDPVLETVFRMIAAASKP